MLDHSCSGTTSRAAGAVCRRSCGISSARVILPRARIARSARPRDEELERVHAADYLRRVAEVEAAGGGMLDPDTWVSPGSNLAAHAGGGSGDRGCLVRAGSTERRALCRGSTAGPPCAAEAGMGFCIYANVAVAAAEAVARHELNRVLIVDFDVHHGNGTQDVFYASDRVGFLSIHRYPFYPGTGARDETGHGAWAGPYHEYSVAVRDTGEVSTRRRSGQVSRSWPTAFGRSSCLISAGFDAHAEDPVGDLGLEVEDFEILTREIVAVAETHAGGPNREHARRGLQCADPGRRGRRTSGALGAQPRERPAPMTPTGFEPVLHA